MNVTDFTYIINKPEAINEQQTDALQKVVDEFPYFQSARALRLKGLYNQNSFRYNQALKVTASHTTDRTVLFEFITSDSFTTIQKGLYEKKILELMDIGVVDFEIVESKKLATTIIEYPLTETEKATESTINESDALLISNNLEIGKPLEFSRDEKHSFQEWLQLSRFKPIDRSSVTEKKASANPAEETKKKKAALIDKFIETSPKISPIKSITETNIQVEVKKEDYSYLMTETLARVYLEQKKYQRAIQAYEILILKYPEKSSLFANRISDIKILEQNNK